MVFHPNFVMSLLGIISNTTNKKEKEKGKKKGRKNIYIKFREEALNS